MRLRKKFSEYKEQAIALRKKGNTYADIRNALGIPLPQSTLSEWLSPLALSEKEKNNLARRLKKKLRIAQAKSIEIRRDIRQEYLENISLRIFHLPNLLHDQDIAKIALAMIYWCEGTKGDRASLSLGNSDPFLIKIFLALLRGCYAVDEKKFRVTVQCRADQAVPTLEIFWAEITRIPRNQFYSAQIDPRTLGKPTKKFDYKGVCKIDYFSAEIYNELKIIIELLGKGL